MKKTRKIISAILLSSLLLTSCNNNIEDTLKNSKASASDINAEWVFNNTSLKMKKINKFESANINIDFSLTPSADKSISGNIDVNTHIKDISTQISTKITNNDSTLENNTYLDHSNLLFSLNEKDYHKFDLSNISGLSSRLQTIMKVEKKN